MLCKEKYYFRRSRLSEAKFRLIMRYFTHDLPASKLAALSDEAARRSINGSSSYDLESPSFVTPHRLFPARLKGMNPLLAPAVSGEKRGVEPGVKQSSSESWNSRERSTRRSSRMPLRSRYRP